MRFILKFTYITLISLFFFSCSGSTRSEPVPLRFIIFGNTNPASPFTGNAENLPRVISYINMENPALVIHSGNIIHGGYEWMGIKEADLVRQYKNFNSKTALLTPTLYTIAGEKDLFNDSIDLYKKYTGKYPNYSFNYSNNHLVVLSAGKKTKNLTSEYDIQWLKNDLERHKDSSAIFVFTHHPLFYYSRQKLRGPKAEELHQLFRKYPVKAVFSGSVPGYHEISKDSIRYIIAGCGGYTKEEKYLTRTQYYIITFNGKTLRISPKSVTF
ncbi:MAG: hypothetical protein GY754_43550 [bacterium]|nr:hypothetical protein [bacterium]